jgi:hypothetical protein
MASLKNERDKYCLGEILPRAWKKLKGRTALPSALQDSDPPRREFKWSHFLHSRSVLALNSLSQSEDVWRTGGTE